MTPILPHAYIERQLTAFAQGSRQNDINQQMRTIAAQLTQDEIQAVAANYSGQTGYVGQTGHRAAQK